MVVGAFQGVGPLSLSFQVHVNPGTLGPPAPSSRRPQSLEVQPGVAVCACSPFPLSVFVQMLKISLMILFKSKLF